MIEPFPLSLVFKYKSDLTEAMEAQGYDISIDEAMAYLKASIAVHNRDFYMNHRDR